MDVLSRPGRRYRRFRHENRYDTPLLIFFADTTIMLAKYALLIAALLTVWVLAKNFIDPSPNTSSVEVAQENDSESPSVTADQLSETLRARTETDTEVKPLATAALAKPNMVDGEWVTRLNPEHFIVQYGTSPDLELLEEFIPIINNEEEIAIYPFKKTPTGRLVYGIATGVYTDLDTALESLEELPAEARAYEPWVRPIKDLITQINSLEKEPADL